MKKHEKRVKPLPHLALAFSPSDVASLRRAIEVLRDVAIPQIESHKPHGSRCGVYSKPRLLGLGAAVAALDWLQDGYEDVVQRYGELSQQDVEQLLNQHDGDNPDDILSNDAPDMVITMTGPDGRETELKGGKAVTIKRPIGSSGKDFQA